MTASPTWGSPRDIKKCVRSEACGVRWTRALREPPYARGDPGFPAFGLERPWEVWSSPLTPPRRPPDLPTAVQVRGAGPRPNKFVFIISNLGRSYYYTASLFKVTR